MIRRRSIRTGVAHAVLALVVVLSASSARAMHRAWDQDHDTFVVDVVELVFEEYDVCRSQPSPFIAGTGAYTRLETDLFVPGRIPLEINRSFHGRDSHNGMFGRGWTFSYGMRLIEVSDGAARSVILRRPNGQRQRFHTSADGSYETPPGATETLKREPDGSFVLERLDEDVYRFTASGELSSITDRYAARLSFAYDSTGFLVRVSDDQNRSLLLSKGANGKVATITGPGNRIVRYGYDAAGNLTRFTDPTGAVTQYTYDPAGNLTSLIDPRGNTQSTMTYDVDGLLATYTQNGVTYTITYSPDQRTVKEQDSTGNRRTIVYNERDNIVQMTDPLGNVEAFEYDERGNTTAKTDKRGFTTHYTYDTRARLTAIIDALGNATRFTYDPATSQVASVTDELGRTSRYEYDPTGNLVTASDASGNRITLAYDARGQLTRITDARNRAATLAYDANGSPIEVVDPTGNRTTFGYAATGDLVSRTTSAGKTTSLAYDGAGRITRVTDDLGAITRYAYDPSGNMVSIIDANQRTTTFEYDTLNRLSRVTDPLNAITTFTYDARGRVSRIQDPNLRIMTLQYDRFDRLILRNISANTYEYEYDAEGNPTMVKDNDSQIDLFYDALGRVVQATTSATLAQPATTISYTYDAVGNRRTMTDPLGGVTSYRYNAARRLRQVRNPLREKTKFVYDALGRLTVAKLPNRAKRRFTYDAASQLSRIDDDVAGRFDLSRDPLGRPTSISEPGGLSAYAYDALDRLTAASHPEASRRTESYAYDAVGNRLSSHLSSTYGYDAANQLKSDDQFNYVYDNVGNLIRKTAKVGGAVTTYTYDGDNQLIEIDLPNRTTTEFRYDGLGRRIQVDANGAIRHFVYDYSNLLLQYDESNVRARYTTGFELDAPISVQRGEQSFFYHFDAQRNVTKLSDVNRNVVRSYLYDSFGRILAQPGSVANPLTFQARELEADSGLYYFRARYYDPSTGRFLQRDTESWADDISLYAFAADNPVLFGDPTGRTVTYYYWPPTYGANSLNVGHAAISVSGACSADVSFFPNGPRDKFGSSPGGYLDIGGSTAWEGGIPPKSIDITGLVDEAKLCDWINKRGPGRFQLYFNNCSTTAGEALAAGGLWQFAIPFPAWPELVGSRLLLQKGDLGNAGSLFLKSLKLPYYLLRYEALSRAIPRVIRPRSR